MLSVPLCKPLISESLWPTILDALIALPLASCHHVI
jgi:hypothetical protein